jgi:hypothetical protein
MSETSLKEKVRNMMCKSFAKAYGKNPTVTKAIDSLNKTHPVHLFKSDDSVGNSELQIPIDDNSVLHKDEETHKPLKSFISKRKNSDHEKGVHIPLQGEKGSVAGEWAKTKSPVLNQASKNLHQSKLNELKAMEKPSLGKSEHQPHPGPSLSEHQKIYDAKKQAEREARLKSPEGEKARQEHNKKLQVFLKQKEMKKAEQPTDSALIRDKRDIGEVEKAPALTKSDELKPSRNIWHPKKLKSGEAVDFQGKKYKVVSQKNSGEIPDGRKSPHYYTTIAEIREKAAATPVEKSELKKGDSRLPKIDVHYDGKYLHSTNKHKTLQSAKDAALKAHGEKIKHPEKLKAFYDHESNKRNGLKKAELQKAKVDDGKSVAEKRMAREHRNKRESMSGYNQHLRTHGVPKQNIKGVHLSMADKGYAGPHAQGTSHAGKFARQAKHASMSIHSASRQTKNYNDVAAKELHYDNLKQLQSMPKPNLGKAEQSKWGKLHGKLVREGYSPEVASKIAGSIKAKARK